MWDEEGIAAGVRRQPRTRDRELARGRELAGMTTGLASLPISLKQKKRGDRARDRVQTRLARLGSSPSGLGPDHCGPDSPKGPLRPVF